MYIYMYILLYILLYVYISLNWIGLLKFKFQWPIFVCIWFITILSLFILLFYNLYLILDWIINIHLNSNEIILSIQISNTFHIWIYIYNNYLHNTLIYYYFHFTRSCKINIHLNDYTYLQYHIFKYEYIYIIICI